MIFSKSKPSDTDNQLVNVFSALGDKTRYQILKILSRQEGICVSELAAELGISTAGVSQQLRILEQAGLVLRNRQGQKICYSVKNDNDVNRKLYKLIS